VFHYFDILVFIFLGKVNRQIDKSTNRQIDKSTNRQIGKSANCQIENSGAKIYKPFLKNNKNENFFKVYL